MPKKYDTKITTRKMQVPYDYVEAGDLSNEIGKFYMKDLESSVQRHAYLNLPNLYFIIKIKKDPTNTKKIVITIGITNKCLNFLQESTDLWEYDYKLEKLRLIWSVPHRTEMKNFLKSPEKYNKKLIKWIKAFLKHNSL